MTKRRFLLGATGLILLGLVLLLVIPPWRQAVFGVFQGDAPIRGKFLMKWEYVEIQKAENGEVRQLGDRKAQTAAGGESLGVNNVDKQKPGVYTQGLYVIEVGPTKAKFRLTDDKDEANQEAVVESGSTQDIWLAGHRAGIRVRVESISPIQK